MRRLTCLADFRAAVLQAQSALPQSAPCENWVSTAINIQRGAKYREPHCFRCVKCFAATPTRFAAVIGLRIIDISVLTCSAWCGSTPRTAAQFPAFSGSAEAGCGRSKRNSAAGNGRTGIPSVIMSSGLVGAPVGTGSYIDFGRLSGRARGCVEYQCAWRWSWSCAARCLSCCW